MGCESVLCDIARAAATALGKVGAEVVKAGYQVGKATGEGTLKGTAAIVKEIGKKATGN